MFFDWLNRIREKPKEVRERYALLFSVMVIAVIAGIWSLSLPSRFSELATGTGSRQEASAPLSGVFANIKNQFPNFRSKKTENNDAKLDEAGETKSLEELVRQVESGTLPLPPARPVGNIVQITTTSTAPGSTSSELE